MFIHADRQKSRIWGQSWDLCSWETLSFNVTCYVKSSYFKISHIDTKKLKQCTFLVTPQMEEAQTQEVA